ncbi:hypothetical protein AB0D13_31180 [Streptomyces sp. NPDC048430]|uniref:hypothetical protein n=1 Tax=unclassified Streptomyces TaxID=2593676 RepID=UPI003448D130
MVLGTRAAECAVEVARDLTRADNRAGTAVADIDLVVMPWVGQAELLTSLIDELCDKAVVDLASARLERAGRMIADVVEGSAAEQLRDPPRQRGSSAVILEPPRALQG